MRTRIDHADVWNAGHLRQLSIMMQDETVEALIAPEMADQIWADRVMDARNCWILPGVIDFHVHISDGTETIRNGACCAAAGGITTVLDMAPFHGCVNPQQFQQKAIQINESSYIDVGLVAGIVIDQTDLTYLNELMNNGTAYFKVFQPAEPVVTNETLWKSIQSAAKTGLRLGFHAENPTFFKLFNPSDTALAFAHSRPVIAEYAPVSLLLEVAYAAEAPIYICHVSSGRTAESIAWGKNYGIDVTSEVPAHYLLLDENAFLQYDAHVKTTPPLRSSSDKTILWQALSEGVIDLLACDHNIENQSAISAEVAYMIDAPAGIAGLEVSLPLLFNSVMLGQLSLERFVEITAETPARLAGIMNCKGVISPGMDADFTIWDPNDRWAVNSSGPFSRTPTTPYFGWNLAGRIRQTLFRGQVVWNGETISVPAGYGKWIPSRRKWHD